jgi:uncharacterized protein with von Willebrand factor type A (vWA) domain
MSTAIQEALAAHRLVLVDIKKISNLKLKNKRRQRERSGEDMQRMEEQLEEMRLKIEKEKAEREAERKARQRLEDDTKASAKSMRTSMKTFYPTSWKNMKGRDHKHIDNWDLPKLQQMETEWHKDYTAVGQSSSSQNLTF